MGKTFRTAQIVAFGLVLAMAGFAAAAEPARKPNILVIMGDDIGWFNPSIYHRGIMGYRTPNIDRIAHEGAMFTTGMDSKVVRPAGQPSLPGSRRFEPVSRKSDSPARISAYERKTRASRKFSSRWDTPPGSSERTIWATRMNFCLRITASMSSSVISTI